MMSDKETNWWLPGINVILLNLRLLSYNADDKLEQLGGKAKYMIQVGCIFCLLCLLWEFEVGMRCVVVGVLRLVEQFFFDCLGSRLFEAVLSAHDH